MKKNQLFFVKATIIASLLTGCVGLDQLTNSVDQTQPVATTNSSTTETVQTVTNQLSNDYYRALIVNGSYQTSPSRGVTLSLNSGFNLKNFETGLMNISSNVFPTSQYYFREGQSLNYETVHQWISRMSDTNPDGLNPADNGSTDPATRAPYYLAQILEQDYMIQTENNYELGGITIGLAMNSVDYYRTPEGTELQQPIDDDTLIEQAKIMANTILTRLRQNDDLKTIPIVFGVFKQSPEDDIGGGVFILQATSVEGTEVTNWQTMNQAVVVLPLTSDDPTEESVAFENFRTEVQNFFPNLSGVTARVNYSDGVPQKMVVNIMTQFYGEAEMIALAQHVTDVANKYLPKNTPVEVRISSVNGMEAFLLQDMSAGVFSYHIFD